MIHAIDVVLDYFSNLFRSHRYSPLEKIYSVILITAGLSLRKLKERLEVLHQRELEEVEELEELVTTMAGGEEVILT
jgi:hypothetical protein